MEIERKIDDAFEILSQINEVKVSNSFKQNVLDKALANNIESKEVYWFTPKLQLVAMIVILLVNSLAIMYSFSSTSDTTINSFAEEYNFKTTTTSLIN